MNITLFFGFYLLAFSIILFIVYYFSYIKKVNKDKRCIKKVIGNVIRYSSVNYNGVKFPIVEYTVNDTKYRVTGPRFRKIVKKTVTNNFSDNDSAITSNLNESKELPETLIINIVNNGFVNYRKNPLTTLYKVGSEVNVFYNPSNPHESYVERFIKPSKVYNLILIFSLISLISAIILFII